MKIQVILQAKVTSENDQGTKDAEWFTKEEIENMECFGKTKEVIEKAYIRYQKEN